MIQRKPGFYWVLRGHDWIVAEWCSDIGWLECGDDMTAAEDIYTSIGPHCEPPDAEPPAKT